MSQLILGVVASGANALTEDDDRLKPQNVTYHHPSVMARDTCKSISYTANYQSSFWPRGSGLQVLGDAGDVTPLASIWYDMAEISSGMSGSYFISGYARDASGRPTAGVTLKLYLTSTDAVVSTTTSAADGSYSLATGFGGANHYIVAYLSGGGIVPDTEGTTVNSLVPGIPGA